MTDGFFRGQYSDSSSVLIRSSPWKGVPMKLFDGHISSMTEGWDGLDFGKYNMGIRTLGGCEGPVPF